MSIIDTARRQTAVWWSRQDQPADEFGVPKVCAPEEIRVRWDDGLKQFIDKTGSPQMSKSQVMFDFKLKVVLGDYLFLGTLDLVDDLENPESVDDAWEIIGIDKTPNIRNTETLAIAML